MTKRHELSDPQWAELADFFPPRPRRRGGRWRDDRTLLNGVFWRLNTGAPGAPPAVPASAPTATPVTQIGLRSPDDVADAPNTTARTYAGVSDRSRQRTSSCPRLSMCAPQIG
jgi:transposase